MGDVLSQEGTGDVWHFKKGGACYNTSWRGTYCETDGGVDYRCKDHICVGPKDEAPPKVGKGAPTAEKEAPTAEKETPPAEKEASTPEKDEKDESAAEKDAPSAEKGAPAAPEKEPEK